MRVLVLGARGMLGHVVFRVLSEKKDWQVFGSLRSESVKGLFPAELGERLVVSGDVEDHDALAGLFSRISPDVVVNCIARTGQVGGGDNTAMQQFSIHGLLPHRLAVHCSLVGARLIHISTDGVFSGDKGRYTENDSPDATDIYGVSKRMGEVDYPHTISLRTSMIGHSLPPVHGLLEWFLSQEGECRCYTRAVFSGLPTVELARIIRDVVIPREDLFGIYHVAAEPISKFDLLRLVAEVYGKSITLIPDDRVVMDRSLNAERFRIATGYVAPAWHELISDMHSYR